jgi:cbb3-type cytochrome oxidase subunit 3
MTWEWIWFLLVPLVFIAVAIWVFRPGSRRRYQKNAQIPLEEDKPASKRR